MVPSALPQLQFLLSFTIPQARKRLQRVPDFGLLPLRNGECDKYAQAPSEFVVVPAPGVEFDVERIRALRVTRPAI
jgi:hypothetical protein